MTTIEKMTKLEKDKISNGFSPDATADDILHEGTALIQRGTRLRNLADTVRVEEARELHIYDRIAAVAQVSREEAERACTKGHEIGLEVQTHADAEQVVEAFRSLGYFPGRTTAVFEVYISHEKVYLGGSLDSAIKTVTGLSNPAKAERIRDVLMKGSCYAEESHNGQSIRVWAR